MLIVFPVGVAVWSWTRGLPGGGDPAPRIGVLGPLAISVGVSGLVAVLAAAAGLPAAVWIARRGWAGLPLLVVGMLMPTSLAYAGWGLLRAPGSVLGDWLERQAERGHDWVPMLAGQALAVLGLVLWSFPIAGLISGLVLRRVDPDVFDAMRAEAPGRVARWLAIGRLALPSMAAGAAGVFLLTLGSAVPLHLAQIPTMAIGLWLLMDQTPQDQWWRVWAQAWPLVAVAGVAAWWMTGRVRRGLEATGDSESPGRSGAQGRGWGGAAAGATLVMWLLAVGAPLVLLGASVRQIGSFERFWRTSGGAMGDSVLVALMVAATGAAMTLATAASARDSGWAGRVARASVFAWMWACVMPGVLIGALLARAYAGGWARFMTDQAAFVAAGHVARFGIVALLLGAWAARTDAAAQRDLRVMDGAGSVRGYFRAALPLHLPAALCAGLFMGAMSLHEIESSVILQPPGVENLARQVLQMLHFSRMEELSVAVVYLVGCGLVLAAAAAWIGTVAARRADRQGLGRSTGI